MKVTERVEKGSGRIHTPAKLSAKSKLVNSSSDQTVRRIGGKMVYIDMQGQPIKVGEARTEPVIRFTSVNSSHLDPGQDAAQSIDVDFPAEALPTATEAGLPGYEVTSQFGLLAPRGTADHVVRRLNAAVLKALTTKDIHDALSVQSIEAVGSSPEELASLITSKLARCSRVIKSAGIRWD